MRYKTLFAVVLFCFSSVALAQQTEQAPSFNLYTELMNRHNTCIEFSVTDSDRAISQTGPLSDFEFMVLDHIAGVFNNFIREKCSSNFRYQLNIDVSTDQRMESVRDIELRIITSEYEDEDGAIYVAIWSEYIYLANHGLKAEMDSPLPKELHKPLIKAFQKLRKQCFEEPPMLKTQVGGLFNGQAF